MLRFQTLIKMIEETPQPLVAEQSLSASTQRKEKEAESISPEVFDWIKETIKFVIRVLEIREKPQSAHALSEMLAKFTHDSKLLIPLCSLCISNKHSLHEYCKKNDFETINTYALKGLNLKLPYPNEVLQLIELSKQN